jgi:hypothetical protein
MSWAARRRFIILLIIGVIVAGSMGTVLFSTLKKPPSCVDNIQNQNEEGIDCGGSCPYLCSAGQQPPTVLFTKAIGNGAGRTDVIASVENKNVTAAAKNIPYRVQLYGADNALIHEANGTLDLPPGATEPVFISGIASGKQIVANAFLDIASSAPRWFTLSTDPRTVPSVSSTKQSGTTANPRVEAILTNPSSTTLTDVQTVVLVRDAQGGVIAVSSALIPLIPAQGQATATFTWNSAFTGVPASIEVKPIIPLP